MNLEVTSDPLPFRWEYFDLSCSSRDATNDQVLKDAVASGARLGAIFKEVSVGISVGRVGTAGC